MVCLKSFHCSLKLKLQLWFVGSTDLLELVYLFEKITTRFWLSTTRVTGKPTNLAVRLKGLKVRFKFNFNSKIKSCHHRNLTHFKLSYHFHKPLNFNWRACISKHGVILRVFQRMYLIGFAKNVSKERKMFSYCLLSNEDDSWKCALDYNWKHAITVSFSYKNKTHQLVTHNVYNDRNFWKK